MYLPLSLNVFIRLTGLDQDRYVSNEALQYKEVWHYDCASPFH